MNISSNHRFKSNRQINIARRRDLYNRKWTYSIIFITCFKVDHWSWRSNDGSLFLGIHNIHWDLECLSSLVSLFMKRLG